MRPEEMLRRALDGELDSRGRERLQTLLDRRPELRKEYERLRGLVDDLKRMGRPEPAEDLSDRVMREILRQRRLAGSSSRRAPRWAPNLAYAAAAMAACIFSGWLGYSIAQRNGRPGMRVFVPALEFEIGSAPVKVAARAPARPACEGGTRVRFVLKAPSARSVSVVGDFNRWSATAHPMEDLDGDGVWTITVSLRPGVYQYNLLVDGTRWVTDPAADAVRPDGFGGKNSVLRL